MTTRALAFLLAALAITAPGANLEAEDIDDFLHLKFGGMRPGSGVAFGLELRNSHFRNGALDLRLESKISIRLYQRHEIELIRPHFLDPRVFLEVLTLYRSETQVDFFGIGPGSSEEDHSDYSVAGLGTFVTLGYRPARRTQTGVRAGYLQAKIGPGTDAELPSVEESFDPESVPGLGDSPSHALVSAFVVYDWRDDREDPRAGGYYELQSSLYEDIGSELYGFYDLRYELESFVPVSHRFTLASRVSGVLTAAPRGQTVPFHLLPTLGGASTLHAFENDRFRDRHTFVVNSELRYFASRYIRLSLFVDAGEAFPALDAFRWGAMELSYGAGVQYKLGTTILMGLSAGFGREGIRVSFLGDFRF